MRRQQLGGRQHSPVFRCLQRVGYGRHARRVRRRWRRTGRNRGLGQWCRAVYRDGERDLRQRGPGPGGARRRRDHRLAGRRAGRRGHGSRQPAVHDRQATLLDAANGSGTWDTGCHWRVGGPTGPLQAWCDGSDVVFVGPPGTVTIVNPVLVASLTFLSDGYVIEGNTITLNPSPPAPLPSTGEGRQTSPPAPLPSTGEGSCRARHPRPLSRKWGGIIDVALGSATIDCEIAGSGLVKTGGGTLVLAGLNSYSISTTVSAGVLQLQNGAALPLEPRSWSTAAFWTWAAPRRRMSRR